MLFGQARVTRELGELHLATTSVASHGSRKGTQPLTAGLSSIGIADQSAPFCSCSLTGQGAFVESTSTSEVACGQP